MMNTMQKSVLALAVLATTSLPALAESVDVRVTGTITPTACTPTLSGGGTIDYGAINPASLSATDYTVLPEKQIDLSITCDAPAKIAVKALNKRPGTLAGVPEGSMGTGTPPAGVILFGSASYSSAGLGLDGTDKIGGYALRLTAGTAQADGTAVDNLFRDNSTLPWKPSTSGSAFDPFNPREVSWAATGQLDPVAFTTLNTKVAVQAYLNKASELDLSKPVVLDGLTTLELVYL